MERTLHAFWLNCLTVTLPLAAASVAFAKAPEVRFDLLPSVACRDVTDAELNRMHPGERMFEARLEISALLGPGDEEDLSEYMFRMTSSQRTLRIVDYSPRTTLASDYNGGIAIEEKQETSRGGGIAVTAPWEPVKVTGHGDAGQKTSITKKYELAAPVESVAASGTIEHGLGVYFRLRKSRLTSLEGSKEFQLVFRAPASWRADLLLVSCEARGVNRGLVRALDEEVRCGAVEFPVALYRAGDEEARAIAERYGRTSQKLRRTVVDSREEIQRRSYPTLVHELGGLLELTEPKIPSTWLQQLLVDDTSGHGFENRLPAQVRSAAADYLTAKRDLRKLTR